MKKRILITACGGHYIGDVIKCYRRIPGVDTYIIGVASEPDEQVRPLLDEYIKVPRCSERGYYDVLLMLCETKGVDILIPSIDDELVKLRNMKDQFASIGTMVSVSDCTGLETAVNKLRFLEILERFHIPHPAFKAFDTPDGFVRATCDLGYPTRPVCVKALDKGGSRGFRIIDANVDLFRRMLEEKPSSRYISMQSFFDMYKESPLRPQMLVQEYLPGAEYSVDLLADRGEVLYMVGRRNHVVDNSIPLVSELMLDEKAYEISRQIVDLLNLDGNIGIDFIYNAAGEPIPIEVNARITATISLCAVGGMNLAALQVMRMLGMELPESIEPIYGTSVIKRHHATYHVPKGANHK